MSFDSKGQSYEAKDGREHKLTVWYGNTSNAEAIAALQDREWDLFSCLHSAKRQAKIAEGLLRTYKNAPKIVAEARQQRELVAMLAAEYAKVKRDLKKLEAEENVWLDGEVRASLAGVRPAHEDEDRQGTDKTSEKREESGEVTCGDHVADDEKGKEMAEAKALIEHDEMGARSDCAAKAGGVCAGDKRGNAGGLTVVPSPLTHSPVTLAGLLLEVREGIWMTKDNLVDAVAAAEE